MANHGILRHEMPCFEVQWSFLSKFYPTTNGSKGWSTQSTQYFIAVITCWKVTLKKPDAAYLRSMKCPDWSLLFEVKLLGKSRSMKVNEGPFFPEILAPRHGPSSRIARGCWVEMFVIELDGTKGWTCPVQLVFFFNGSLVFFVCVSVFEFANGIFEVCNAVILSVISSTPFSASNLEHRYRPAAWCKMGENVDFLSGRMDVF